jgi:thioredoxin reductase
VSLALLVVGAGPAGVSCALQARRDGLEVLLVGQEPVGGLLGTARRLDNFPGLAGISGPALAGRLADALARHGVQPRQAQVTELAPSARGGFRALLASGEYLEAGSVCLASGTRPRSLPAWARAAAAAQPARLVREARALPAGLQGQAVAVVGGGEAALDTALWTRDRGAEVQVLLRGATPRAPAALVAEARAAGVRLCPGTEVLGAEPVPGTGGWRLTSVDGPPRASDWLVVCIGREPRLELLPDPAARPPGLFLAGDVQNGQARYAALALADGMRAALAARDYLEGAA